jgi:hypothetical protein
MPIHREHSPASLQRSAGYFKVAQPPCIIKYRWICQSVSTTCIEKEQGHMFRLKWLTIIRPELQEYKKGDFMQLCFSFVI